MRLSGLKNPVIITNSINKTVLLPLCDNKLKSVINCFTKIWQNVISLIDCIDKSKNTKSQPSILTSCTCRQNNQTFAFTRGYFWDIRPIIRKPHIICAVILVNPCFIHVHDIIPCFPKRFDLSQIITPIINTKHLIVQNSSIITYFL